MLQLNYIREKKEEALERLAIKNFDAGKLLDEIIKLDDVRKRTQNELDSLLKEENNIVKKVGDL